MGQVGIPNNDPAPVDYTITRASRVSDELVTVELVLSGLQRATVAIPYRYTSSNDLAEVIEHTVAGIYRPTKPVGGKV